MSMVATSGIYLIIATLDSPCTIQTKSSNFELSPGWYFYCGSAMKNLFARVRRHLSTEKKHHWHIDYLLDKAKVAAIAPYIVADNRMEHELAALLSETPEVTGIPGFGAGDCDCDTHLFFSESLHIPGILQRLFARQIEYTVKLLRELYLGIETPVEKFKKPWELLVSCIISLRTKDEVTGPAAARLFREAPGPKELMGLPEEKIEELIFPAGFYKTKARNLKKVAEIIHSKYHDVVPNNKDKLLALPNVGIKTANLVLADGFGRFEICVDTHVHRISNRLGWIRTGKPEESEKALKSLLPKSVIREVNGLMVKHGQNICKPLKTLCSECPIKSLCLTGIANETHSS